MVLGKEEHYGIGIVFSVPSSQQFSPRVNGKKLRKRLAVYQRDGYQCKLCGKQVTKKTATLDHVIPRSKGGTGAMNNLVTACAPCNRKKDDKLMRDYGYEWNHWTYEWEKRDDL